MNNKKSYVDKIFWGLLFILAGVCLLLSRLGYLPEFRDISLADFAWTLLFIWMIVKGLKGRNFFLLLFGIALIGILYDRQLGITALTPMPLLLAALFISIGLTIIFPAKHRDSGTSSMDYEFADKGMKTFEQSDGEVLYFRNSFGATTEYVNTDALVNATFENSFGQMKVYFDNAIIKNGTADINVQNSFGELALFLPATWNVENHVKANCASVNENNRNASQGCPTLRIYGEIAFGNVTITYI